MTVMPQTTTPTTTTIDRDAMQEYVLTIADAADRWFALLDILGLPSDATPADVLHMGTDADVSVTATDAEPSNDDRFLTEVPPIPAVYRDGFLTDGDA